MIPHPRINAAASSNLCAKENAYEIVPVNHPGLLNGYPCFRSSLDQMLQQAKAGSH
jgi:hypothetical protein